MGNLFGTDGVRGIANTELTCQLAFRLGQAAALVLTKTSHHKPKILIGKDTRISSDMLEAALISGICSVGADAVSLGVIPTPAVAYLVRKYNADAGAVISASHNPIEHNGIKFFSGEGYKLPDEIEEKIEKIVLDPAYKMPEISGADVGKVTKAQNAAEDYVDYIISTVKDTDLTGIKIAIDCANGASSETACKLFARLGAECIMLHSNPDGLNINEKCGSTHMDSLCKAVVENNCHLGVAFDGDADRCLAVDEKGNIVDGDKLIAIFSNHLKENGRLSGNTVVVTSMSNMGFLKMCEDKGINYAITKVGDRYVLEEMRKGGYCIGGEQSGHIIFLDYATTGDGQLAAVQLLSIYRQKNQTMSQLASVMEVFPQVLINVEIANGKKAALSTDEEINKAISECQQALSDSGRVLIRASGTEPKIRVMVEGRCKTQIQEIAERLASLIKTRLC